ncbi:MAG: thioredoxin-like domain-containing protein [Anaerolineae bacterium]
MIRKLLLLLVLALVPLVVQAQDGAAQEGGDVDSQYAGRVPAPEFPTGVDWLNVPAPLTIEALRGKIVILDFWTYGCINCIHMIPTLQRLEAAYGDALVVISIHSAKFANEGSTQNIRQIVQRYGLEHPVINDSDFVVWQTYGVNAWPTFYVIDPRGNILARQPGEIPFEAFDRLISGMVDYFDSTGEINHDPLELALEGAGQPPGLLAFPGKVLADEAGGRLFIADSNHNRIVVADLDSYEILDVIGSSATGFDDGVFEAASFDTPQGMALRGDTLYVADMENHAVRAANLTERTVTTVAGTGRQLFGRALPGLPTPALQTDLSSPWDLAFGDGDLLYIAMAGTHQIWGLHTDSDMVEPLIGDGSEGLVNAAFEMSALAQPSGLYYRDGVLYFADSESSTIRDADTSTHTLQTLAGTPDNNLFDFGDVDGAAGTSRLQHPLGVTGTDDGRIYVADTYNSRIKLLDPLTDAITTLAGAGESGGFRDGVGQEAEFDEPGGLSAAGNRLFVADTNNHAIRVIDLATAQVSTVTFPNPERLQIGDTTTVAGGNLASGETIALSEQTVAPGEGAILVRIVLPDGYKINPEAPSRSEWNNEGEAIGIPEAERAQPFDAAEFRVPVTLDAGSDTLHGYLTTYYCEAERETLCFIDDVRIEVPVTVSADASASEIVVERAITPPQVDVGGITG